MTDDEITLAWEHAKTPAFCTDEIADIEAHCDLACGKFPVFCNTCEVASLLAVLKAKRKALLNGN